LGVTTPAVQKVFSRLEKEGRDAVVFHARTTVLERLARAGMMDGVIDITPFEAIPMALYPPEYIARLVGAPEERRERLTSVLERGLPWIIAPGGLDMHIFPGTGIDSIPEEFRDRAWTMHGPGIVLVRTSGEELEKVAAFLAEAAAKSSGPVAAVIPLRGFSETDKAGAPLFDPEADRHFVEAFKKALPPDVEVLEVDCHINDEGFADAVMRVFDRITQAGR
ncbi:MAG: Tm-1-like ATP-binding domain-containing protein, partial [Actinomycetota bacterium]|nr:Tm-1-like ATP-binding domain-containing protein [Actinomycetota bacterium]